MVWLPAFFVGLFMIVAGYGVLRRHDDETKRWQRAQEALARIVASSIEINPAPVLPTQRRRLLPARTRGSGHAA
ncbi:MAG: hypothetical protein ACRDPT_15285 [Streptomycetales bacterium]